MNAIKFKFHTQSNIIRSWVAKFQKLLTVVCYLHMIGIIKNLEQMFHHDNVIFNIPFMKYFLGLG